MKLKRLFISIIFFSILHSSEVQAAAGGEMLLVESRIYKNGVNSLQFTLNGKNHFVCASYSAYCPTRTFISINPNEKYFFDLYNYEGSGHISDSCRGKTFVVKPNQGKTINILKDHAEIVCQFSA